MSIVTEAELRDKLRRPEVGAVLSFRPGTRFTPSASDFIKQWRLEIRFEDPVKATAQGGVANACGCQCASCTNNGSCQHQH